MTDVPMLLAFILALSGAAVQEASTDVDAVTVEARKGAPTTLPDKLIIQKLNDLRQAEPERVVCVKRRKLGTYIPQTVCGTLRQWYDQETTRDTAKLVSEMQGDIMGGGPPSAGPPDELVQMIKQRMKDPKARALAAERAQQRIEARASASSN